MNIIFIKGFETRGKKLAIGTRMTVTPERFLEFGDAAIPYNGPMAHVRKKTKTDLFKPKEPKINE
jgi:hypothetical protein